MHTVIKNDDNMMTDKILCLKTKVYQVLFKMQSSKFHAEK